MVHDALEIIACFAASYLVSFTPRTIVMSSPLAGAEMMTFCAPASICLRAPSAVVNRPVDSRTRSTPRSFHGSVDANLIAVDDDRSVARANVALIGSVHRVVLEEMRECVRIGQVIDSDELDVGNRLLPRGPKHLTSDTSKPVDANANSHSVFSPGG